jgi:Acyl-CoA dehydrogenase, C-terminal domain
MDDELVDLVRRSVQLALTSAPDDIGAALTGFGWNELVSADEAFAYTTLFEAQGYLAADTDALDVVTVAGLDTTGPGHVVWPVGSVASHDVHDPADLTIEGIALRRVSQPEHAILVPSGGRLCALEVTSLDEKPVTGMAQDLSWCRVRATGTCTSDLDTWSDVERRASLAVASELVGVAQRILDTAVAHATDRRQFGRPIGANQAVRHRLAEASSDVVGARALVAAAWEDGSCPAASWAKAVAGSTHDAVAKQAIQVCGAIGLSEEHDLPALVRRGFALDALLGSATTLQGRLGSEAFSSAPLVAVAAF